MISQLDHMVMEGGKGDGMYKDKFRDILLNQCEQHMALRELGSRFVQTVTRLMELLLEYRYSHPNTERVFFIAINKFE
jgi:hypothetical protein